MRHVHLVGQAWIIEPGGHSGTDRCRAKVQRCLRPRARAGAATDRTWPGASVSTTRLTSKGGPPTRGPPMGAPERVPAFLSRSRGTPLATALPPPPSIRRRSCPAPGRSSALPRASACAHRVQFFQRDFARFSKEAPASPERFRASFWPHERRPRKPLPKLDQRSSIPGGDHVESSSLAWTRASCLSTIKTTLSLTLFKHG